MKYYLSIKIENERRNQMFVIGVFVGLGFAWYAAHH